MSDKDLTSFCGLWCCDCIPSNERLYSLASELSQLLADIGFENYAEHKSKKIPEFEKYQTFIDVLNAFEKLHCYNYCRKGPYSEAGCDASCKIRICAKEKKFDGCWECDRYFDDCDYIKDMEKFHPDIKFNLRMIKEHGMDDWKEYRGKHYHWNK